MFDSAADAAKTVASNLVVPFQRRTYRAIGYLLLTLPLGLGYFAFIVVGFLLGFGLLAVLLGIPILSLTLAGVWRLMRFEYELAAHVLDEPFSDPSAICRHQIAWWTLLRCRMVDRRTYSGALLLLAKLPAGVVTVLVTALALAPLLTLLVSIARLPLDGASDWPGVWQIDTVLEVGLIAALIPLAGLLAIHALLRVARIYAQIARRVFGQRVAGCP